MTIFGSVNSTGKLFLLLWRQKEVVRAMTFELNARTPALVISIVSTLVVTSGEALAQGQPGGNRQILRCTGGGCQPGPTPICGPGAVLPAVAKIARLSGTVSFSALINKQGSVDELELLQGHPFLVEAAMEAAKRYRYSPMIQDGKPTAFKTVIWVPVGLAPPAGQADCSFLPSNPGKDRRATSLPSSG